MWNCPPCYYSWLQCYILHCLLHTRWYLRYHRSVDETLLPTVMTNNAQLYHIFWKPGQCHTKARHSLLFSGQQKIKSQLREVNEEWECKPILTWTNAIGNDRKTFLLSEQEQLATMLQWKALARGMCSYIQALDEQQVTPHKHNDDLLLNIITYSREISRDV